MHFPRHYNPGYLVRPLSSILDQSPQALITGFDGVPHAQSENVPPATQLPSEVSKFSLYGKLFIVALHWAKQT